MNYSPTDIENEGPPTITAFDSSNNTISCYDISVLAPINSTGLPDPAFEWRGISFSSNEVARVEVGGAYPVLFDIYFAGMLNGLF
jgi:hypothetical protein